MNAQDDTQAAPVQDSDRQVIPAQVIHDLVALYSSNQWDLAERKAREMVRQWPDNPHGWQGLGSILLTGQRFEEALEPFDQAVRLLPRDADLHHTIGTILTELGRLEEAETSYRRAACFGPDRAETHYALGTVLDALGRLDEAETSFRRTLDLAPEHAKAYSGLGTILNDLHRIDEAEAALRRALDLDPGLNEAHNNLGLVLYATGRLDKAEACFRHVLSGNPDLAAVHANLAVVLKDLGRLTEAEAAFRAALDLAPEFVTARNGLGTVLMSLRRLSEAEQAFLQVLATMPDLAEAHNSLGNIHYHCGRLDAAEAAFRRVVDLAPDFEEGYNGLGNVLQARGHLADAESCYRQALALAPRYAKAYSNLGTVLIGLNRYTEAAEAFGQAVEIAPDMVEGLSNLGNVLNDLGRFDEAEPVFRRALKINPAFLPAHNNLLFCLNYTGRPAAETRKQAEVFGHMVESGVPCLDTAPLLAIRPARLRVGLVSGDLRRHPVGYFLETILSSLNPDRIEIIGYPTWNHTDAVTNRLRANMAEWTPLSGLSDDAAAARIRADGVHVLIDLAGHTAQNRLPIFARKPAPLQVAWLGYFATTGLSRMDYILGDPQVTPDHEAGHFTEAVWRMPNTYLCFTAPDVTVDVGPLPALTQGAVTFGSFNKVAKLNDAVVASWARVLHAVPGSRLLLIAHFMLDAAVRQGTINRFAAHGIPSDRLVLQGPTSRGDLLAAYNRVDIALDPFPFTGGATSAEALWMGVPVLTRKGDHFIAHQGETLLTNAGLTDWIARDDDDFVAKAVAATADLDALAALRAGLRAQVLASPLFDAPRFARQWEDALWQMWTRRAGPK